MFTSFVRVTLSFTSFVRVTLSFMRVTLSFTMQAKCLTGRRCRRQIWDVVACSVLQECHRTECQTMVQAVLSLMEVRCGDMPQGNETAVVCGDLGRGGLIVSGR
jgi:hypothetical protein